MSSRMVFENGLGEGVPEKLWRLTARRPLGAGDKMILHTSWYADERFAYQRAGEIERRGGKVLSLERYVHSPITIQDEA